MTSILLMLKRPEHEYFKTLSHIKLIYIYDKPKPATNC
jgi:hypothetical protein